MFLILSFISYALLPHILSAQDHDQEQPPRAFVATVTVKDASACSLDEVVTQLKFTAEFRVVNEHETTLILVRGAPVLYYWRVSTDAESLTSRKWAHYSYIHSGARGDTRGLGPAPDKRFVLLRRGAHHSETVDWAFLLTEPLKTGTLWAQVIASPTDDWEPAVEAKTAAAWRRYGHLWTGGIRSRSFPLTIDASLISPCKNGQSPPPK